MHGRTFRGWLRTLLSPRARPDGKEAEQPFLSAYAGQTTEELINLASRYRVDSIVVAFDQAIQARSGTIGMERLSDPERIVLAVEAFERDVNNDGFDGFLRYNAAHVPEIVDALTTIDAHDAAEVARSAIAALHRKGPLTKEKVETAMDAEDDVRDAALSEADERYYGLRLDLATQLFDYIRAHSDQIMLP